MGKQIDKRNIQKLKKTISVQKKEINKLKRLVDYDYLTKLYNRHGFRAEVERFINSIKKEKALKIKGIRREFSVKNLAFMFIDLNYFKEINDTYGHKVGDDFLVWVGKILKNSVRDIDIVCRWSGDEFIIVLIDSNKKFAENKIEKIKKMFLQKPFKFGNIAIIPSASFGTSSIFNEKGEFNSFDTMHLIKEADKEMYNDKRRGKGIIKRLTRGLFL